MKDFTSIHENELDEALNALFLNNYSHLEDEALARFCMEQEHHVKINPHKEAELLARLNGKQGGGKNILFFILGLLLVIAGVVFVFNGEKKEKKIVAPAPLMLDSNRKAEQGKIQADSVTILQGVEKSVDQKKSSNNEFSMVPPEKTPLLLNDPASLPPPYTAGDQQTPTDLKDEKTLPYFDAEGIEYFGKIKERMLQKLVKIDDFLYAKTEPGTTIYKNSEVIVAPFVMSNFAVTNLQYKTFLADLSDQGRTDDLKKCLPKQELWKEYGCTVLAKDYFENESYNDFPVVNVDKEACLMFCGWLEEQMNQRLSGPAKKFSASKGPVKKKRVVVRLPFDYEWIYSADAAYTLIPDCGGYNTIYDASEGLVDKDFYKRTSQISKRDLRKETRMDKLSDVNRFGMTEAEMISIFREAMNYRSKSSAGFINYSDPASYPYNMEACCLAGHVCELIKDKEGEMKVRGCCWKNKEEYLKMLETYKKNGASPFIGFRVLITNAERGTDKDPFW